MCVWMNDVRVWACVCHSVHVEWVSFLSPSDVLRQGLSRFCCIPWRELLHHSPVSISHLEGWYYRFTPMRPSIFVWELTCHQSCTTNAFFFFSAEPSFQLCQHFLCLFWDKVSLRCPSQPWTHCGWVGFGCPSSASASLVAGMTALQSKLGWSNHAFAYFLHQRPPGHLPLLHILWITLGIWGVNSVMDQSSR